MRGPTIVECEGCGIKLPPPAMHFRIEGWAKPRKDGGVHAYRADRVATRWRCGACIPPVVTKRNRRVEVDPAQLDLFG